LVKELLSSPLVDPAVKSNICIRTACGNGDLEIVKLLLADPRVDPTAKNSEAFYSACFQGRTEIVKLLLDDGRVNPGADGNRSLQMACWHGYTEIVNLLLQHPSVDATSEENQPFITACSKGHWDVVTLLLMDPSINPSVRDNEAFRLACRGGHVEVVKLLLDDDRIDPIANENEAFQLAAASGSLETVSILLKDPRVDPASNGNRAIELAASFGHCTVVQLLSRHPMVHIRDTATFSLAVQEEYPDIVHTLLNQFGDYLRDEEMENCQAAFANACGNDNVSIVEELLEFGVDPTFQDNYSFMMACEHDSYRTARRLLLLEPVRKSLDVNSCAMRAAKYCALEVISLLLEDPRLTFGFTDGILLRIAITCQSLDVMEKLMKHPKIELDKYGQSCFELACKFQSSKILKLLLSNENVNVAANCSRGVRFAIRRCNMATMDTLLCGRYIDRKVAATFLLPYAVQHGQVEIASRIWVYAETGLSGKDAVLCFAQIANRNRFLSEVHQISSNRLLTDEDDSARESSDDSDDDSDVYASQFQAFMAYHGFVSPFEFDSDSDDLFPEEME
jgi:ankyrin repeat protein